MNNIKYVTCELQGFLGNTLFQIAAAMGYGSEHNLNVLIPPDWKYRDIYSVPEQYFTHYDAINSNNPVGTYIEQGFHYNKIPENNNIITNLSGYFQSYKYFSDIQHDIISYFKPKLQYRQNVDKIFDKFSDNNKNIVVSIHYRIGDYLKFPNHHPVLSPNYYINAIKYIKNLLSNQNIKILWFSDSMSMTKNLINTTDLRNLVDSRVSYHFIEGNKDYEDMYLQSLCPVNIIGNSTYSYWSAYLNTNQGKIVLAPAKNKHFGTALQHYNMDDYYPLYYKEIQF